MSTDLGTGKFWLLCLGDHLQTSRKGKSADVARGKALGISSFSRADGVIVFSDVFADESQSGDWHSMIQCSGSK
jgi:hypothetical protein